MEAEMQIDALKLQVQAYKDKCDRLLNELVAIDKKADDAEVYDPSVIMDSLVGPVIAKQSYDKMRLEFAKSRAALRVQLEHFKKGKNA